MTESANGSAPQSAERSEESRDASGDLSQSDPTAAAPTGSASDGNLAASGGEPAPAGGDSASGDAQGSSNAQGADGSGAASGEGGQASEGYDGNGSPTSDFPEGEVTDGGLDPAELEDLNRQLDESGNRDRGSADPLQAMAEKPIEPSSYERWLEGLVELYRGHTAELRAIARRAGHAAPELPYYPPYKD